MCFCSIIWSVISLINGAAYLPGTLWKGRNANHFILNISIVFPHTISFIFFQPDPFSSSFGLSSAFGGGSPSSQIQGFGGSSNPLAGFGSSSSPLTGLSGLGSTMQSSSKPGGGLGSLLSGSGGSGTIGGGLGSNSLSQNSLISQYNPTGGAGKLVLYLVYHVEIYYQDLLSIGWFSHKQ